MNFRQVSANRQAQVDSALDTLLLKVPDSPVGYRADLKKRLAGAHTNESEQTLAFIELMNKIVWPLTQTTAQT